MKTDIHQCAGALAAQVHVVAALHDAEQGTPRCCAFKRALAALGPGERKAHRALQLRPRVRQLDALVELHRNVRAKQRLDFDGSLGRQIHHRAIDVRAEDDALVGNLAKLRQRHDLEAAGVGQDRPVPVHEFVQAAERRDPLGTGPQHQVVGVAQKNFRAGPAHRLRREPLHRGLRADRHEGRRLHPAVRRCERTTARGAVGADQAKGKRLGHCARNSRDASP
jgi:hypothetical protein